MPDKPAAHLLHFLISHYNEKVRWALDRKRWPHSREALVPGLHIARARLLSGQQQLPILVLDGKPICGSSQIIAELDRRSTDVPLIPEDPQERERALAIQAHFDQEVAPDIRRLFWSTYLDRYDDCVRMATMHASPLATATFRVLFPLARSAFRRNMAISPERIARSLERTHAHFDRIEADLGDRRYLVGDRFTVADLTVAAVMSGILRPPEFPYPLPEPQPPALVELRASFADRRGFDWVLDLYARERDPSMEVPSA